MSELDYKRLKELIEDILNEREWWKLSAEENAEHIVKGLNDKKDLILMVFPEEKMPEGYEPDDDIIDKRRRKRNET